MSDTPVTLLDRLRGQPAPADWDRFHGIYGPLLRAWLSRVPGLGDEIDDLAQQIMLVVFENVGRFERRRDGAFRAWLRAIVANKVRSHRKKRARRPVTGVGGPDPADDFLAKLEDPASGLSSQWDRDHDKHVFDRVLGAVRPDFEPRTWEAFTRFAVEGQPAARVAADLGVTENAVILAKARVLKRLREEAGGLID